jgi:hypothetical protein
MHCNLRNVSSRRQMRSVGGTRPTGTSHCGCDQTVMTWLCWYWQIGSRELSWTSQVQYTQIQCTRHAPKPPYKSTTEAPGGNINVVNMYATCHFVSSYTLHPSKAPCLVHAPFALTSKSCTFSPHPVMLTLNSDYFVFVLETQFVFCEV